MRACDQLGAVDLAGDGREVDLARRAFEEQVHRLANDPPRTDSDQDSDAK
jgi:hypothetical protein